MNQGEKIHGFVITAIKPINELSATMIELEHEKTGLRVVRLDRPDDNKLFSIAFRTAPENHTGVFHILEHSVLNGSVKYPVREPFVELLKSSMNTFLNALTFPDKTMYPVSSKNTKDFYNLMRVYLDAVFNPLIYKREEIFMQEGWHYEFDDDGNLSYKGVVFNEMKGAFADETQLLVNAMNQALFPDSEYRFVSGGDPKNITDLSYEEFLDAHKRFYAPSNAIVFLDGVMDLDEVLGIIDDEYLRPFGKTERIGAPVHQSPVDGGTRNVAFEVSPEENTEKRYSTARGFVYGDYDDRLRLTAVAVLTDYLAGNNQAPLSKVILDKGLAEDVVMFAEDGVYQPWVNLEVKNTTKENLDLVDQLVKDELQNQVAHGLDHDQLRAIMANLEFKMRERDYGSYPQGLILNFTVLDSMLYGGAPELNLEVGDLFEQLTTKMDEGYFEQLLQEVFLDNPHTCRVVMTPSSALGADKRAFEEDKLKAKEAEWSVEDKQALLDKQARLLSWQQTPDMPEQLASIPKISRSDVDETPEDIPTSITTMNGITVLRHDISTGGILYYNLYFDVKTTNPEKLSRLSLMTSLLGQLRTKSHSADDLANLIKNTTGSLSFGVNTIEDSQTFEPSLQIRVSFSTLAKKRRDAFALVMEILTETVFEDEDDIFNLLRQAKTGMYSHIIMSGHAVSRSRVLAQFKQVNAMDEAIGGFEFYKWLRTREETKDAKALAADMAECYENAFFKSDLVLSGTGTDDADEDLLTGMLSEAFPVNNEPRNYDVITAGERKEIIIIPADIAFASRGGQMDLTGLSRGKMLVARSIINFSYLWNTIRVQGGAYGCGFVPAKDGSATFYSYRDPNPKRSLEEYKGAAAFIDELAQSEGADAALDGAVISAMSDLSPLLTPRQKGLAGDRFYFTRVSDEDRRRERHDVLTMSAADLARAAEALEKLNDQNHICVLCSQGAVMDDDNYDLIETL